MKTALLSTLCVIVMLGLGLAICALSESKPRPDISHDIDTRLHSFAFGDGAKTVPEEMQEVIRQYRQTGDAHYASPRHRITMLHIAAMTHRLGLVNELLGKGADVNARMLLRPVPKRREDGTPASAEPLTEADTPLTLALRCPLTPRPNSKGNALIARYIAEKLLDAGADITLTGERGRGVVACCSYALFFNGGQDAQAWEDTVLMLLAKGAPAKEDEAGSLIQHGWVRALQAMRESPQGGKELWRNPRLLMLMAQDLHRDRSGSLTSSIIPCVSLLLSDYPSAAELGEHGHEALMKAVDWLDADDKPTPAQIEFVAQLLDKGLDPCRPLSEGDQSCAADIICANPALREALKQRGHTIEAPPHHFTPEGVEKALTSLPTGAVRPEEVLAHWDVIASVLSTAPAEAEDGQADWLHPFACTQALALLHRDDAPRALACLQQSISAALDTQQQVWFEDLMEALSSNEGIALPAEWLHQRALACAAAGQHQQGQTLVRLLARNSADEAKPLLDSLCAEGSAPALRAAAWSTRLRHEGLPDLVDAELESWLYDHTNLAAYPPVLRQALTAERAAHRLSPTPFHPYTNPQSAIGTSDKVREALLAVGAPKAAECYVRLARSATPPWESSDEENAAVDTAEREAALIELELAYAQYIWKHRELLRRLQSEKH